jgi:hypothetical protein
MKTLLMTLALLIVVPSNADAQIKNKYVSCDGFLGMDSGDNSLAYSSGDHLCEMAEIPPLLLDKVLSVCGVEHCRIRGTISGRGAFEWSRIYSIKRLPPPKKD